MPTISLRPYRASDIEPLVALANDARVARALRDRFPHPYTRADGEAWIAIALSHDVCRNYVIEVDGAFAGAVGIAPFEAERRIGAEIGYWLGQCFWGRGIATDAVAQLVPIAFESFPELQRLEACTYSSNPASARVLEKNGFTLEGTLRNSITKNSEVLDQHIYALLRD